MSRDIFDAKMAELKATQGKTGTMFSNEEYQNYIERLKAISQPGYDMKPDDYYLVKRFKILRVEINGKIYERLVKPGSRQLKYITFEGLFDAISEAHKPGLKHAGRDKTHVELQRMYANISQDKVMAYIESCEVCSVKKQRIKKGIVVKPIVSKEMNSRCQVRTIPLTIWLIILERSDIGLEVSGIALETAGIGLERAGIGRFD